jgi:hypothetical protein
MKKLTVEIILFLLPLIILISILEIAVRSMPNQYKYKKNYVQRNNTEIEILVLGQSQTQAGLIPENFGLNCFSFAIDAQSLRYDLEIFNKFSGDMTNLRYIILPFNFYTFYFETTFLSYTRPWARNYPLYLRINSNEVPLYNRFEFSSPAVKGKLLSLYRFLIHGDSLCICHPLGNNTTDTLGISNQEVWQNNLWRDGEWQIASLHERQEVKDANMARLSALIDSCKKRNIKVILVTPPVARSFRDLYDKKLISDLDETNQYANKLGSDKMHVHYLNYYDSDVFCDSDYLDPTHLNLTGAIKFTELINNYILSIE